MKNIVSPWGKVVEIEELIGGVYFVVAENNSGIVIEKDGKISDEVRNQATVSGNHLFFENGYKSMIISYELKLVSGYRYKELEKQLKNCPKFIH